jgi:L-amino acid N-acyltransferase YncA
MYRRRGVAQRLLMKMVHRWTSFGWGCAPFAFIENENTPSMSLFSKLGFERQSDAVWVAYGL